LLEFALFFVSLFSILNPLSVIPAYVSLTEGTTPSERHRITRQATMAVFLVLAVSYVAGRGLLLFFGISVASLRVAGGLLIMGIAWNMLHARMSSSKQTPEEAAEAREAQQLAYRQNIGVIPLGMPLLAGPGSISLMIIMAERTGGLAGHLGVIAAVLLVSVLSWVILLSAGRIARVLGQTGMNIVSRFMGLMLAAIAVEVIASGLRELFPAWTVGAGP
jgi:multiple antibiotic resistance protein